MALTPLAIEAGGAVQFANWASQRDPQNVEFFIQSSFDFFDNFSGKMGGPSSNTPIISPGGLAGESIVKFIRNIRNKEKNTEGKEDI